MVHLEKFHENGSEEMPPFCSQGSCKTIHHELIIRLVNIEENDESTFKKFKATLANYKDCLLPEHPIPDTYKEYQYPVLQWASVLGKINAVKFLIENGHDPTVKSQGKGETALHRVVLCLHNLLRHSKEEEVIEKFKTLTELLAPALLIVDDNKNTPCHTCAIMCNETANHSLKAVIRKAFEIMIDKIIEMQKNGSATEDALNIRNREKKTLLHILAVSGSEDWIPIIRKLLQNGADPEMRNYDGKSPIDIAKENQNRSLYKELKQTTMKRQRCEDNVKLCGMPVEKEAKLVPENTVTSTTAKDTVDESKNESDRASGHLYRRKPNHEVKPSLVTQSNSSKSKNVVTAVSDDAIVSAGPSFSAHSCEQDKDKNTAECHDTSKIVNKYIGASHQKGNNSNEKNTLEELLKRVNMEPFILDQAETVIQQLEHSCIQNDEKLQEVTKDREQAKKYHEQISNEIKEKKKELETLQERLTACEVVLKDLDTEYQRQEQKRSELIDKLNCYTQIVKCLGPSEQES